MPRLQPLARPQPNLTPLSAGLALVLLAGFAHADSDSPEGGRGHIPWADDIAWITGIGTVLYHDSDQDGYHSAFRLAIDADTSMNVLDVYVSIDLQSYYGSRERLYTSGNFSLYGQALTDEYQIEIELLQNYPTGNYDLFVELHDTYDHRVLDRIGATEFSNLSALPLESEDLDNFYDPRPPRPSYPPANDDIRVAAYAGSSGLLLTLSLCLSLWLRRKAPARRATGYLTGRPCAGLLRFSE